MIRSTPLRGYAIPKKLSPSRRDELAKIIRERALPAPLLAMQRAVGAPNPEPEYVLVDGNRLPQWDYASEPVIGGDDRVPAIAAASRLATVHRDNEVGALESVSPGHGFAAHKGYPTARHLKALQTLGVTPIHRRSFAPVKKILASL